MRALFVRTLDLAGRLLYRLGLARLVYALSPAVPRVVLYHACEPEESDFTADLRSNVPPEVFARHLAFFRRHYDVVGVERLEGVAARAEGAPGDERNQAEGGKQRELGEAGRSGSGTPLPKPPLAITFDDGYRSVHEHALPRLREAGLPATMYLISDVIGNEELVWVNELNWWLRHRADLARPRVAAAFGLPDDAPVAVLIDGVRERYDGPRVERLIEEVRAAATDGERAECSATELFLDWDQIGEMRDSGFTFGCHTVSHPNLRRVEGEARRAEIGEARRAIEERLGPCTSFAYPFGDVDDGVRAAAASEGFATLMEVGGANRPWDPHRVARVPVYGASAAALFAELEVVAPVKEWLRRRLGA